MLKNRYDAIREIAKQFSRTETIELFVLQEDRRVMVSKMNGFYCS